MDLASVDRWLCRAVAISDADDGAEVVAGIAEPSRSQARPFEYAAAFADVGKRLNVGQVPARQTISQNISPAGTKVEHVDS